jgi:hypothetical protein
VPLSSLQTAVLTTLVAQRNPESYVAVGTPLNRHGPRISDDIDLFHDREESVARVAIADGNLLMARGFGLRWLRQEPGLHAAVVSRSGKSTRLEWLRDSDFRFFPAQPDPLFGYRLHAADLATNKAFAAAGRREPRDALDLLHIHARLLPLGAVIWAAVGKDQGYSPESLIEEICRNARYRADDFADLRLTPGTDVASASRQLRNALREAETFVRAMPDVCEGVLFLREGRPMQPDPERLGDVVAHAGQRRGHWPGSSEIGSAMLGDDLGEYA